MMTLAASENSPAEVAAPTTIYQLLATQARLRPGAPAILAPGRKPLTYGRLLEQLEGVVRQFHELGLGRRDRVAVVLPNGPEMAVAFVAVVCAGVCAPLNPAYRADEFDFYLSDLGARAVIVLQGADSPVIAVARSRGIPALALTAVDDAEAGVFRLAGSVAAPVGGVASPVGEAISTGYGAADDVALVLHTSGTTSRPKIVPLSQRNLCFSARHILRTLALCDHDRCLNVMPLFHIHGLVGALLSSLAAGGSVICTAGFDAEKFFAFLAAYGPTWYTAVPTMHQALLDRAGSHADVIAGHRLRFIRSSSSSLPPAVMAELERVFQAPVIESYGMTEASHQMASGIVASSPLPPGLRKPGSVGPAAGPEIAIMNEEGTRLPAGAVGEIVIRGPNVTTGYESNPTANASAFTGGWFRTGDQGYLDEDGYLFITGRIKEIINRGGEKVSPREIDEVLLEHPAIAQAIAFAVPHPRLGEDIAAAVVLRENEVLDEQDIREFAFARLADHKVPSQVVVVDQIPKGPTGKLQRIGLHEKLAALLKAEYVAPRNSIEEVLVKIFVDVLHLESIGVYDNLFLLGVDSLLVGGAVARVRAVYEIDLPVTAVFRTPRIADLAAAVEAALVEQLEGLSEEKAQESEPDSRSS